MDILGLGVLVIGESGIGKSECALDLVVRGHRLVADDAVEVRSRAQSFVLGQLPGADAAPHGDPRPGPHQRAGSVRRRVDADVEARRAGRAARALGHGREYDRLGLDESYYELLGTRIPMIRMPVAPGRNVAILVEVAARNQLLRSRGHHAARRLARAADAASRTRARRRSSRRLRIDGEDLEREHRRTTSRRVRQASVKRSGTRAAPPDRRALEVRRPDRPVGIGKVAGDPRARGPRLLLRRQPAGRAAADAGRADAARRQRDLARRRRRRRPRGRLLKDFPGIYRR